MQAPSGRFYLWKKPRVAPNPITVEGPGTVEPTLLGALKDFPSFRKMQPLGTNGGEELHTLLRSDAWGCDLCVQR